MNSLRELFLAGKLEAGQFAYVGVNIKQTRDFIYIDQSEYLENVETPGISAQRAAQKGEDLNTEELTELRSIVGKLNWLVQGSRPDMAFEMIELSTKFRKATVGDLLRAVKSMVLEGGCITGRFSSSWKGC